MKADRKQFSTSPTIDVVVRLFHWTLAAIFVALFITADQGDEDIHALLGHLLASLLTARLLWGVIGSPLARWKSYTKTLKDIGPYLPEIFGADKLQYKGHNPAGSMVILLMLTLLLLLVGSGLLVQALFEYDGILLFLVDSFSEKQAMLVWQLHDWTAHVMLAVIAAHVLGVLWSSYKYQMNLPALMVTGKTRKEIKNET